MGALDECQDRLNKKFKSQTGYYLPIHTMNDGIDITADDFYVKEIYEIQEEKYKLTAKITEIEAEVGRLKEKFTDLSFEQFLQRFNNWTGGDADEVVCKKVYDELLKNARAIKEILTTPSKPQPPRGEMMRKIGIAYVEELRDEIKSLTAKITELEAEVLGLKEKNEDFRNKLEDVVNELDLSESAIEKHGPLGAPPAELVKLVLEEKDLKIRSLKSGFKTIEQPEQETKPSEVTDGN